MILSCTRLLNKAFVTLQCSPANATGHVWRWQPYFDHRMKALMLLFAQMTRQHKPQYIPGYNSKPLSKASSETDQATAVVVIKCKEARKTNLPQAALFPIFHSAICSCPPVRACTVCLQLPRFAFPHQTVLPEPAGISKGAKPFLFTSNSAAIDGKRDSNELHTQAC